MPNPTTPNGSVNGVTAAQLRPVLVAALLALPDRDRDVLLLIAWEDLTYDEIAVALSIPIGTVRSRLDRVRRKLRAALDATTSDDPNFEELLNHG